MNEVMLSQLALRVKAHSPVSSDQPKTPQSEKSSLSENATHTCYKNTDTCRQTVQGCTVSKSTTDDLDDCSDTQKKTSKPLLRPISDATVLNVGDEVYLKPSSEFAPRSGSSPYNPLWTVGVITATGDIFVDDLTIEVRWTNGKVNIYTRDCLWLVVK